MAESGYLKPAYDFFCSPDEAKLIQDGHLDKAIHQQRIMSVNIGTRYVEMVVPNFRTHTGSQYNYIDLKVFKEGLGHPDYDSFLNLMNEYITMTDFLHEFMELYKEMTRVCRHHVHVKQILGFATPSGCPDDSTVKTKRAHAKIKLPSEEMLVTLSGLKLTGIY